MIKKGYWWISSKSDPRWKGGGEAHVGGFLMPDACKKLIEKLTRKYGDPPEDLEWSYMKD